MMKHVALHHDKRLDVMVCNCVALRQLLFATKSRFYERDSTIYEVVNGHKENGEMIFLKKTGRNERTRNELQRRR